MTDVRMAETGNGARLAIEALPGLQIGGKMCGKNLDGNGAIESCVTRAVHLSHAALTKR